MRLLPRWHTPESVAKQLIAGLESGALTLEPHTLESTDLVEDLLRVASEINAGLLRSDPSCSVPDLPTFEELAALEQARPDFVRAAHAKFRELHSKLLRNEARQRVRVTRLKHLKYFTCFWGIATVGCFTYLYWTLPLSEFIKYLIAFAIGCLFSVITWFGKGIQANIAKTSKFLIEWAEIAPRVLRTGDVGPLVTPPQLESLSSPEQAAR